MTTTASSNIRKQLSSIAECSVCFETFSDPRQLPCIHTYCLKCIGGFVGDILPGNEVPCPLCRKNFTIPEGGISCLPKNFFVQQLMDIAGQTSSRCQGCCVDGNDQANAKSAIMFCVECSEMLCESCVDSHRRVSVTRKHELVELSEDGRSMETVMRFKTVFCDKHTEEAVKLYCFECKKAICMMCYVKLHKSHECSDVKEVSEEFQKQMTEDIKNMYETVAMCRKLTEGKKVQQKELNRKLDLTEQEIRDRVDELKQILDKERENLLDEMLTIRTERNKQMNNVVEEIEQRVSVVESMVKYTEQLRDKGTASDIAQQTNALHIRAGELMKLDGIQQAINNSHDGEVVFKTATWPSQSDSKVLGEITESKLPTLKHVIPAEGREVVGVTSINNELFVLRHPSEEEIQVYETATFTQQRTVRVAGLSDDGWSWHKTMTSCVALNCLFVNDGCNIYKVNLSTDNVIKWRVEGGPSGLSVYNASHVIVTCHDDNKIRKYKPDGTLFRTIELMKSQVTRPWHAVQLTDRQFIVSHWGPQNGVSLLDKHGGVVATYRNSKSTKLLNCPMQLTVLKNGSILVVDLNNNRLVVLNASLRNARDLTIPIDGGLHRPRCVYFNESVSQLYVGEQDGQRVITDHVNVE